MEATRDTARDAVALQSWLEELPSVLSTGANHSSYQIHLAKVAERTHQWMGLIVAGSLGGNSPEDCFYPLIRADRVRLPDPEKSKNGQLQSLLFLQNARWIFDLLSNASIRGRAITLALAYLQLPTPACPVEQRADSPCDSCDLWAHCAVGQAPLGVLRQIEIHPYHFKKSTEFGEPRRWRDVGDSIHSLSYRFTADPGYPLSGARLRAFPQFYSLYS